MVDFVWALRPVHTCAVRREWSLLRRYLAGDTPLPSGEELSASLRKSDGRGMSPLMIAVDCLAEVGVLRALVVKRADIEQQDNEGYTALDWSNRKRVSALSEEERRKHREINQFLLKACPPRPEFGICGLDITLPEDLLPKLFTPPPRSKIVPVAAFQLAYQGFPWNPAVNYRPEDPLKERRYPNGATYPAWHEIDSMIAAMPPGTRLSFHLSESEKCRYVSSLLQGEDSALRLVETLCKQYNARHIQINISADFVSTKLYMRGPDSEWDKSAKQVAKLAREHPNTLFLVPCFKRSEDEDSLPFICKILQTSASQSADKKAAKNIVTFFDNSGGQGKTPDAVPEVPEDVQTQVVGFTGGMTADNVTEWLSRYDRKAEQLRVPYFICDAQTGFRECKQRSEPIDTGSLSDLMQKVYLWLLPS